MKIKKDERYRFNEETNSTKPKRITTKSTAVSLKTKQDLDQISRATRVSASGLGKSNNGSFKSVMTMSHFSKKSGNARTKSRP